MSRKSITQRIKLVERAKAKGAWDYQDSEFDRCEWRSDVYQGNTQLGYFDWVIHNLESMEN